MLHLHGWLGPALLLGQCALNQLQAVLICLLELLLRPAHKDVIIEPCDPSVGFLPDSQSFPESTFAEDAEADSLKRFKGPDASWVIVFKFDPADAFGNPAERVIKI